MRLWRTILGRALTPYLIGGALGAPLGVAMLVKWPSSYYALFLGVLVLAYSLYVLIFAKRMPRVQGSLRGDVFSGVAGGVLAGLAGFAGATVTVWLGLKDMGKDEQRAIFQPFILVTQVQALLWLHLMDSRPQGGDLGDSLVYVPIAIAAAACGLTIFKRLGNDGFRLVVNLLLAVSGVALISKSFGF
jgi:uncharacterized membrane protein YfcA